MTVNCRYERLSCEATNVIAYGSHRDRAAVTIRYQYATDWHAVAVVSVRRDDDEPRAGEARRVDDLTIKNIYGLLKTEDTADVPVRLFLTPMLLQEAEDILYRYEPTFKDYTLIIKDLQPQI